MKLISRIMMLLFFISTATAAAAEAKFYKIEGVRENGSPCSIEISFGPNKHGDTPFIAFYGDVLSYIPLELYQVEELREVNNGLREIKFEGEHVWTYGKIRIFFDNQRRPTRAMAKLRPSLSPFWDRDECYLKSPRIDF